VTAAVFVKRFHTFYDTEVLLHISQDLELNAIIRILVSLPLQNSILL